MKSVKTKAMALAICMMFLVVFSVAFVMAPAIASGEDTKVRQEVDDGSASKTGISPESRKMLDVGKTTITIDGNPGDWAGIPYIVSDPHNDQLSPYCDDDIWDVYVTDDGTNLYFRVDLACQPALTWVYLDMDIDENINTGYNTNTDILDWYLCGHDTGIDYMVEVSPYDGTADLLAVDSSGYFTYIGSCPIGVGSVVEVAVPLSAIGEATPSLNMDFQTFWHVPVDEAPDCGNVHYSTPTEPTISIYTDSNTYSTGDTMKVGLDVTNPGEEQDVSVAILLWTPWETYTLSYIPSITLPAGFQYSDPDFMVFEMPELPATTYAWLALLDDPATGEIIAWDYAVWEFGVGGAEKWAVIIGNADYIGTENDLQYTDDDAYDMYDALISGGWQADHIQLLIDADRATIENAINWLASNAGPDDTALFFFSGHGTYGPDLSPYDEADGYDEYICPKNFNNIRDDELDTMLDAINSDAMAVIIDTCFSGGMARTADRTAKTLPKPKVEIKDGFGKDIGEAGRVVLMACDEDELSYETSALQNGVFSYYVVKGLLGAADANSNGEVSAEETFNYADPLVLTYTGGVQDPQIYDGYTGELGITTLVKSIFRVPPLDFQ